MNVGESLEILMHDLRSAVAHSLKELLESKHIYQSIAIDGAKCIRAWKARVPAPRNESVISVEAGPQMSLLCMNPSKEELQWTNPPTIAVRIPNVKIYCAQCDEREVFSPVWCGDLDTELAKPAPIQQRLSSGLGEGQQLFYLALRCERCHSGAEAFLVKRSNWKLTLGGRLPMEHIALPSYVPKKEGALFRDAMIASHGGKPLAALFYLRTFIEQFARRVTGEEGRVSGEELMNTYARTLPIAHKDQMPSLREWYDKLSAAIHAANGDATLFEEAKRHIEQHFDIRRVFKMSEGSE